MARRGNNDSSSSHADNVELVDQAEEEQIEEVEPAFEAPVDNAALAGEAEKHREEAPESGDLLRRRIFSRTTQPPAPPPRSWDPGGGDPEGPAAPPADPPAEEDAPDGRAPSSSAGSDGPPAPVSVAADPGDSWAAD